MKEFVNLFDVHVACTIRNTLNLARAAKKLDIPRATLVASLLRLERRLNNRIFDRRQGSGLVTLTEYGDFILPLFEQLLWTHKNILKHNDLGFKRKNVGEVVVSSTQTLLEGFVIPYLAKFLKENQRLKVGVHQNDDLVNVAQEMNHLYIGCWLDDTKNYSYFPFHNFRHKLWASQSYLDQFGVPEKLGDLTSHRILAQKNVHEKDMIVGNDLISRLLATQADTVNVLDVAGPRVVDKMAELGLGIMIASEETVRLSGLKLQRVLPDFTGDSVEIFVRVKKDFLQAPLCQFILDWIFACRNLALAGIGITSEIPYEPFHKQD